MTLIKHKDKPWEWKDMTCISWMYDNKHTCQGHMKLKDIEYKVETTNIDYTRYDYPRNVVTKIFIEKIWVCDTCGEVFLE